MKRLVLKIRDSLICVLIFSLIFHGCGSSPSKKKSLVAAKIEPEWIQVENKSVPCLILKGLIDMKPSWSGDCKDGFANGYGVLQVRGYDLSEEYKGEIKDGKWNGMGTYTWVDHWKYEGEWKDNLQHGMGTYTGLRSFGTRKYVGEWKNGKMHGRGVCLEGNGDIYEGEFIDGRGDKLTKVTKSEEKRGSSGADAFNALALMFLGTAVKGVGELLSGKLSDGGSSSSSSSGTSSTIDCKEMEKSCLSQCEIFPVYEKGYIGRNSQRTGCDQKCSDAYYSCKNNNHCQAKEYVCLSQCEAFPYYEKGYIGRNSQRTGCDQKCSNSYYDCKK